MSNAVVALLLATGAGVWLYSKLLKTTGNNTRSSLTAATIAGLCIFFVSLVALNALGGVVQK